MKFTSFEFIIFFIVVFVLYWGVLKKNKKHQNILLLISSYFFYGYWDYRFLSLIFISSIIDFTIGHFLQNENNITKRRLLLGISLFANLGMLGVFKYYNFFASSFNEMWQSLSGNELNFVTLKIVLPVGISFYTFQTLSYTIDVYRKKLHPTKSFVSFFAYVSFFPQLVAGPIERAINLLPQFEKERVFKYEKAVDGCRQILWGFFKKIVIADNVGTYVDQFFANPASFSGSELALGAFYFAFQIYCDFSGYSDIAIGTARIFGFNLMKNFNFPYFSRDIGEFWRRWHISLSTWFRDYLYIPLGGSRVKTKFRLFINVIVIFVVSGLWHGANWTFVIWGFLNALLFLPSILTGRNRKNMDTIGQGKTIPTINEVLSMLFTFSMTLVLWVFFRADSVFAAVSYLSGIFNHSFFTIPLKLGGVPMILILLIMEWRAKEKNHALEDLSGNRFVRWTMYIALILFVVVFTGEDKVFIYFQF
ncbi:MAG: MBOAT family protein [Salinivirgaceae bacterium]|nr:MBOAT family protein [Salinivirgaceae bacterium]